MKLSARVVSLTIVLLMGAPLLFATAEKPNVLFISVDDMNDWVGCLDGYLGVKTPNIDQLATRGVLFTNAHACSPKCNPSRAAIMTGLRPSTTGIYANGEWWRPNYPDLVTLPMYFGKNGYHVAGGGKVFHHTPGFNPPDQWDEYFDLIDDKKPGDYLIDYRKKRHIDSFDWGPLDKDDYEMGDGQTVKWAIDFLKGERERPFFLAVGIFQPHLPFYAPRKQFDNYPLDKITPPEDKPGDLDDVPAGGKAMAKYRMNDLELINENDGLEHCVQSYLACISHADTLIGDLVATLDASPHADNTIVVLWSDHGYHFGQKHHFAKNTLWEPSTRVPLIVIAPGVTTPGERCIRPVNLLNLYPTLVDLCSLPTKDGLDGVSITPLLKDSNAEWDRPVVMTFGKGNHAARDERWRYIRYENGGEELYDHKSDPEEYTNLADRPEFVAVKQRLAKWLPTTDHPGALKKKAFDFDEESYTWTKKEETAQ